MPHFTPKRIFGYLLAAVCYMIACWAGSGIVSDAHEWIWLRNAIETQAEILGYEHEYVRTGDRTQRRTTFSYTYSFAGERYSRSTRHLGPFVNHALEADRIIIASENGQSVACYIHRELPSEALLSLNASVSRLLLSLVFMAGFAVAGTCILTGCVSKRYAHQFA